MQPRLRLVGSLRRIVLMRQEFLLGSWVGEGELLGGLDGLDGFLAIQLESELLQDAVALAKLDRGCGLLSLSGFAAGGGDVDFVPVEIAEFHRLVAFLMATAKANANSRACFSSTHEISAPPMLTL